MADPSTRTPGNPGDLQPQRARRGSSAFPMPSVCPAYEEWKGTINDTGPAAYGYPRETCAMCGHPRLEHLGQQPAPV